MAFCLLTEIKKLEKQVQDTLSAAVADSKGKPLPPEAAKLCKVRQTLVDIRTGLEKGPAPAGAPAKNANEGEWGTAFRAPPCPPPPPLDGGPESVADAWVDMASFEET